MNFEQINTHLTRGINWNFCYYILYKGSNTLVALLLYKSLTNHDFAVWATVNSSIYIILLWTDFGLKKSIPRYIPIFSQDTYANKRFLKLIITFYIAILCGISLLFVLAILKNKSYLHNSDIMHCVLYCAPAVFLFEGINKLCGILFHAYFFIKQFNTLATIYTIINITMDGIVLYSTTVSINILKGILINKIIAGGGLMLTSLYFLYIQEPQKTMHNKEDIHKFPFKKTMLSFAQHSGIMWINILLRSVSERNFLMPFMVLMGGIDNANIFKIANDGALLFQRIIVKTIGTSDTSLFAYTETMHEEKKLLQVAFTKLTQKIATLCLPLIGICTYIGINNIIMETENKGFQIFTTLTFCYLFEALLMPYERILEVKHAYTSLFIAYTPYIALIVCIFFYLSKTWIGLNNFISLIYVVRLVSMLLIVFFARRMYNVQYPVKYVANLVVLVFAASIGLYLFTNIIYINPYVSLYIFNIFKNN